MNNSPKDMLLQKMIGVLAGSFVVLLICLAALKQLELDAREVKDDKGGGQKLIKEGKIQSEISSEEVRIREIQFPEETTADEIRVLIKNRNYESIHHEKISLCGSRDLHVKYLENGKWREIIHPANETIEIDQDSSYLQGDERRVWIIPDTQSGKTEVKGLERGTGTDEYPGQFVILSDEEGLILINCVPLEEYLCHVVPSEMPASYPMEALKAQAVCARTYACGYLQHAAYPQYGAHLDDSVQFQVYNNIPLQESTTRAVRETSGVVLWTVEGEVAETYYYSTSCGQGTDETAWARSAEKTYLKGKRISRDKNAQPYMEADFLKTEDPNDYECEQEWYRWNYHVNGFDERALLERLQDYLSDMEGSTGDVFFHKIHNFEITERGTGGVALELKVETDGGTFYVKGENGIRRVLCDGVTKAVGKNGRTMDCTTLLPSAFFVLEVGIRDGILVEYTLTGGGYGHGIGMSQNAARQMALEGEKAEEILAFFYEGCICEEILNSEK